MDKHSIKERELEIALQIEAIKGYAPFTGTPHIYPENKGKITFHTINQEYADEAEENNPANRVNGLTDRLYVRMLHTLPRKELEVLDYEVTVPTLIPFRQVSFAFYQEANKQKHKSTAYYEAEKKRGDEFMSRLNNDMLYREYGIGQVSGKFKAAHIKVPIYPLPNYAAQTTNWISKENYAKMPPNGQNGIWYFIAHQDSFMDSNKMDLGTYYVINFYFDVKGIEYIFNRFAHSVSNVFIVPSMPNNKIRLAEATETHDLIGYNDRLMELGYLAMPLGEKYYSIYFTGLADTGLLVDLFKMTCYSNFDGKEIVPKGRNFLKEYNSPEAYLSLVEKGYLENKLYNLWLAYGIDFSALQCLQVTWSEKVKAPVICCRKKDWPLAFKTLTLLNCI